MPLWGKDTNVSNSVSYAASLIDKGSGNLNVASNNAALFSNNTVDAFIRDIVVNQIPVTVADILNNTFVGVQTPGWYLCKLYTGPVTGITISNGGINYSNSDTITISGGSINATATITTNANGTITSTSTTSGRGFTNVASAVLSINTSTGSQAILTPRLGGRASRVSYEPLIAMRNMGGDTSPSSGFVYMVDQNGTYLIGPDGSYLLGRT